MDNIIHMWVTDDEDTGDTPVIVVKRHHQYVEAHTVRSDGTVDRLCNLIPATSLRPPDTLDMRLCPQLPGLMDRYQERPRRIPTADHAPQQREQERVSAALHALSRAFPF